MPAQFIDYVLDIKRQNILHYGPGHPPPTKFIFEEKFGDVFNCHPYWSMCHCVSRDLAMGAGVAVEFRKHFGQLPELRRQNAQVGDIAVIRATVKPYGWVYYLVTKDAYFDKPTLLTLRRSLEKMRDRLVEHGVSGLAMPRIGCGLDKLKWDAVKQILTDVFQKFLFTSLCITNPMFLIIIFRLL